MSTKFEAREVARALGVTSATHCGTGSYGEIWRAEFAGTEAAYKIIHRPGYDVERLRREVLGYGRISSPFVVNLLDLRSYEIAGMERPVLIFEYISGGDLSEIIRGRLPSEAELRSLTRGLLTGVAAIHSADLLHRDLKPANIALRDGSYHSPVILDLGLAKLLDVATYTVYPTILGTTMYMAPEQLRGERALRATDLWAVGEILFEAATGAHPFFKAGEALTLSDGLRRLSVPPKVPETIPGDVAEIITRCLSDPPYRRSTVAKAQATLA